MYFSENLRIEYQKGNLQLEMKLPDKNSFIKRRIGPIFISSILLILLVAASFVFTLRIYFKEEKRASLIKNFIHNMAHEFKTPVAVINLANSRLRKNLEVSELNKLTKYVEIIDNEKDKIQSQITAILDLAYFEGKNALLKKEKVSVIEIIENAILNINPILKEKNGSLVFEPKSLNSYINCSKCHIINSLTNILDNACKYSNGNLRIEIDAFERENHMYIEITDNGIGISHKDIPYVFDKYFRVSTGDIHNIKGYGIGLCYVKEVIGLHGGKVELESKPGIGSKFTIILPKIIV
jgi:two-component system phosphate regulon sensor histidine kinase PhoR